MDQREMGRKGGQAKSPAKTAACRRNASKPRAKKFKVLARHKWLVGATITESMSLVDDGVRRFTATIEGWRNWKIYEGPLGGEKVTNFVLDKVRGIRKRIQSGDETVFEETNEFCREI